MEKFIKKITLFLLPLFILGITSEILLRNIPKDYTAKREYLNTYSDSLQVLFLGNSHALLGINPDFIRKRSFNASYVSQTYDLDLDIIQKYSLNWKNLEYIVIPVSYCSLFEILSQGPEHWRIKNYVIYSGMNISNRIEDHSEILGNKLWYSLYRMYNYYVLNKNEKKCSPLGWQKSKSADRDELERVGKVKAQQHTHIGTGLYTESFLRSIIAYAQTKNIRVILYTPPGYHSYVDNLNQIQWGKTVAVSQKLVADYPNVSYYNFLNDKDFSWEDFSDSDHLSEQGSQKFTLKIDSILNCQ